MGGRANVSISVITRLVSHCTVQSLLKYISDRECFGIWNMSGRANVSISVITRLVGHCTVQSFLKYISDRVCFKNGGNF